MTTVAEDPRSPDVEGSALYAALLNEHRELMRGRRHTAPGAAVAASEDALRQFIDRAVAAGASIEDDDERHRVQSLLDYWTAELISAAETWAPDFAPPALASFEPHRSEASTAASGASAAAREWGKEARLQVRLAAAARLWRECGGARGYLLSGEALTEAAAFRHDPDIGELVAASEKAALTAAQKSRVRTRIAIAVLASLVVVLAGALGLALYQYRQAVEGRARAEQAAVLANRRIAELDDQQKRLDSATSVIRQAVQQNSPIDPAGLPPDIAATIEPSTQGSYPPPQAGDPELSGYDPLFTGASIPLPALSPRLRSTAFEGGRRVDYINYSLVMDAGRRLAIFTASNLDRDRRVVLRRVPSAFRLDPRLPPDIQPDAKWFESPEIDPGHLVNRHEIAWGAAFSGESDAAARKLASMVDVYPNVAPQFGTFNRGPWSELKRWVLTAHNRPAARVTIFTGPVLSAHDPVLDGARMPHSFWKIAVSPRTEGGLAIDAFIVPNVKPGSMPGSEKFDSKGHRASIRQIEHLTGLDFGPALRDGQGTATSP